ncbi:hypothetical protein IFM89_002341 [Coptis chinensis]|uniref:histone acetyltransferase n=1 Tax=Coptis chinensis TaxID=261450 RepID=A0A835IIU6_9MAGN|nr:hypothetical protein IFM89_002341 [Coptis chinensis]
MDRHSIAAPVRSSRSSQSPSQSQSQSHSASASVCSSAHRRNNTTKLDTSDCDNASPFHFSYSADTTRDNNSALTSNNNTDLEDDSEEVGGGGVFRNVRLQKKNSNGSTGNNNSNKKKGNWRSRKKALMSLENNNNNNNSGVGSVSGAAKEDDDNEDDEDGGMRSLLVENIPKTGAYSAREENLKREEEAGKIKFVCVANDGKDEHMVWLIGLKNIYSKQLPNMPKEYIVRLVMDRSHKSVMVIRHSQVIGGITYRPFHSQKFGEIAFCAIKSGEQIKGYGTRLMNHLKQHARDVDGLTYFLTYADNNAVKYFVKQGFTKEIDLEEDKWQGYIKEYDGGLLMKCEIYPKLPYTDLSTMIRLQRQANELELEICIIDILGDVICKLFILLFEEILGIEVRSGGPNILRLYNGDDTTLCMGKDLMQSPKAIDGKIRELSNCHIVYPGIDFQKKEAGIPKKVINVEDIPGFREAGWTSDEWGHSQFNNSINRQSLNNLMRTLLKACFTIHS